MNEFTEGKVKKGGINEKPTGPRPDPPKGQGGLLSVKECLTAIAIGHAILETNLCLCLKCYIMGTGKQFTAATGGDDYEGRCPNCHAGDEHIISVDDDHEEFILKMKELL